MLVVAMLAGQASSFVQPLTVRSIVQPAAQLAPMMTAAAAAEPEEPALLTLIEEVRLKEFVTRVFAEPKAVFPLLQDAGIYGVVGYFCAAVLFYATAVPLAEIGYHTVSGNWFDPRALLAEDGAEGKAEALVLAGSFYLACKPLAPLRLGGGLLLTPGVKRVAQATPVLQAALEGISGAVGQLGSAAATAGNGVYRVVAPRCARKDELLELCAKAKGGVGQLEEVEQARFDELLLRELPALNPTPQPTQSSLFTGTWECQWTDEKELNFAVANGLFGLPWLRTYQEIDISASSLINVLEFEGGELRVGSTIAPDEADGSRFNFAFEQCSLTWRALKVPLPPVGRGWGELLYLDDELRIQRDVRGDMIVATRAVDEKR